MRDAVEKENVGRYFMGFSVSVGMLRKVVIGSILVS